MINKVTKQEWQGWMKCYNVQGSEGREVVQWVKCPCADMKTWVPIAGTCLKKADAVAYVCNHGAEDVETGGCPELADQSVSPSIRECWVQWETLTQKHLWQGIKEDPQQHSLTSKVTGIYVHTHTIHRFTQCTLIHTHRKQLRDTQDSVYYFQGGNLYK